MTFPITRRVSWVRLALGPVFGAVFGAVFCAVLGACSRADGETGLDWIALARSNAPACDEEGATSDWVEFAASGRRRVRMGGVTADALCIDQKRTERADLALDHGGVLAFRALASEPCEVRIRWADRVVDQFEITGDAMALRQVQLAAGHATLEIDVVAPADSGAQVALCCPVIAPSNLVAHRRPDVTLLLADTYRADNLEAWGGDPRVAPELNRLARTSRAFTEARASATWTLPSHAALFTAHSPPRIGVMGGTDAVPAGTPTLARVFRDAGYRTVAITDGGYVSARFGLDTGFEWFEELRDGRGGNFDSTLAAIDGVIAADDGRPLFLFVQSYRAHEWVVSEATRQVLGDAHAFEPNERFRSKAWRTRLLALLGDAEHGEPMSGQEFEDVVASMEPNYRGASTDTDRGFGRILARLDASGLGEGVLVFTSDHGESFGRHGVVSHGNGVWEGQARVPLLVRAPWLNAGVDRRLASGIDLPRTLAALAGVRADPHWGGADLLAEQRGPRLTEVFQTRRAKDLYAAVVDGRWKWIFRVEGDGEEARVGELAFVYDLRADPNEENDLAAAKRGGQRALAARALIESSHRLALPAAAAQLDAEARGKLRALGYAAPKPLEDR